jgi:rubredoxin
MRKPCLDCGRPVPATRCPGCQQQHELRRYANGGRKHYGGDYRRRAAQVRATAWRCWLCGGMARPGDPWQADHVTPGDPASELRPAHRSCNIARSNKGGFYPGGVSGKSP